LKLWALKRWAKKTWALYSGLVTDISTGKTDGTITPGEDIIATGDKVKTAPEGEEGLGVFFVDANGVEYPLTYKMTENIPKKIVFRVPALSACVYTLKVVTRYSSSSAPLRQPRSITCEFPLTASAAA
jgi:hypothetical protein